MRTPQNIARLDGRFICSIGEHRHGRAHRRDRLDCGSQLHGRTMSGHPSRSMASSRALDPLERTPLRRNTFDNPRSRLGSTLSPRRELPPATGWCTYAPGTTPRSSSSDAWRRGVTR